MNAAGGGDRLTMMDLVRFPGKRRTICIPDEIKPKNEDDFGRILLQHHNKCHDIEYDYLPYPYPSKEAEEGDKLWDYLITWVRHGDEGSKTVPVTWDHLIYVLHQQGLDSLAHEIEEVIGTVFDYVIPTCTCMLIFCLDVCRVNISA